MILGMVGKGCSNSGNFLESIKIIGRHDKIFATKLNDPKKNTTHLSKCVQNQFIVTMGEYLRRKIISEITESRIFTLFADETKDGAKIEQLSIGIPIFKFGTNMIQELTVRLKSAEGLEAASLTKMNNDVIEEYSLNWGNCVGVSFDCASVMSGCHGGVATRLQDVKPLVCPLLLS